MNSDNVEVLFVIENDGSPCKAKAILIAPKIIVVTPSIMISALNTLIIFVTVSSSARVWAYGGYVIYDGGVDGYHQDACQGTGESNAERQRQRFCIRCPDYYWPESLVTVLLQHCQSCWPLWNVMVSFQIDEQAIGQPLSMSAATKDRYLAPHKQGLIALSIDPITGRAAC